MGTNLVNRAKMSPFGGKLWPPASSSEYMPLATHDPTTEDNHHHRTSGRRTYYARQESASEPTSENFYGATMELIKTKSAQEEEGGGEDSGKAITLEDALSELGFGRFQLQICLLSGACWFLEGMHIQALGLLTPRLACELRISPFQVALLPAVSFLGMLVGSVLYGYVYDKFGRRNGILLFALMSLYYRLMCSAAPNYNFLILLFLMVGFNYTGITPTLAYAHEFVAEKHRAAALGIVMTMFTLGGVTQVTISMAVGDNVSWRVYLFICAVPNVLLAALLMTTRIAVESPRFLLVNQRPVELRALLNKMARVNRRSDAKVADKPEIQPAAVTSYESNVFTVFCEYWRTNVCMAVIVFVYGFAYIGIILLSVGILAAGNTCPENHHRIRSAATGKSHHALPGRRMCELDSCVTGMSTSSYLEILVTTFSEFPGLLLCVLLMDILGRRIVIGICLFVFAVSCSMFTICMHSTLTTLLTFICRGSVSSGLTVVMAYASEVYPTRVRGTVMGVGSSVHKVACLLTPFVAIEALKHHLYLAVSMYVLAALAGVVASLCLPRETQGQPMSDTTEGATQLSKH